MDHQSFWTHPLGWLISLWITSAGIQTVAQTTPVTIEEHNWISIFNTLLITIGSAIILLYQKKLQADREEHLKDLQAGLTDKVTTNAKINIEKTDANFDFVNKRLDDVINQRDTIQAQNRELIQQIINLTQRFEELAKVKSCNDCGAFILAKPEEKK